MDLITAVSLLLGFAFGAGLCIIHLYWDAARTLKRVEALEKQRLEDAKRLWVIDKL